MPIALEQLTEEVIKGWKLLDQTESNSGQPRGKRIDFICSGEVPQLENLRACLDDDFITVMYLYKWWKNGYREIDISDFRQHRSRVES